jgi:hypothetical protein
LGTLCIYIYIKINIYILLNTPLPSEISPVLVAPIGKKDAELLCKLNQQISARRLAEDQKA